MIQIKGVLTIRKEERGGGVNCEYGKRVREEDEGLRKRMKG